MNKSKKTIATLSAASLLLGAASLVSAENAGASPLSFTNLGSAAKVRSSLLTTSSSNPYGVLMNEEEKEGEEGKCGEGKCGEGKCGDKDGGTDEETTE